jgi:hypothetical protein
VLARRSLIQRRPIDDRAPCLTVLKYQRSSYTSTAIVFDSDLNLHSVEQLRELARVGVQFNIVDVETDEDVTQTLLV